MLNKKRSAAISDFWSPMDSIGVRRSDLAAQGRREAGAALQIRRLPRPQNCGCEGADGEYTAGAPHAKTKISAPGMPVASHHPE